MKLSPHQVAELTTKVIQNAILVLICHKFVISQSFTFFYSYFGLE